MPGALVYGGQFKQLSGIHCFGNPDLPQPGTFNCHQVLFVLQRLTACFLTPAWGIQSIQTNRRATGFLTSRDTVPVHINLCESIPDVRRNHGSGQIQLPQINKILDQIPSTSTGGIIAGLKLLSQGRLNELATDPLQWSF